MTNSNSLLEIYCTRPSCDDRINYIPQDKITSSSQRYCSNCNMPLILLEHFLPLKLLVPDEKRVEHGCGFGRTFLAKDLRYPNKICVIKQLHPLQESALEKIESLFQQEAEVLKKLSHDQIPEALSFGLVTVPAYTQKKSDPLSKSQQKFFYLSQEFIEGKSLAEELEERGKFSEEEVIDFLLQILNILDYIHNKRILNHVGIIHRDIKPHNIIRRNSDKKFCLIDFGSVKQVVAGVPTKSSCILGTKDYAAPEQWAGKEVFYSSDLYSLAATCVCLLTYKKPEELRHGNKWVWKEYANLQNKRLEDILDLMLSPEPEVRPQSAQEVIQALPHPQSQIEPNSTEVIERRPKPDPPLHLKTIWVKYWFVPVVLLVVASIFGIFVWWLKRPLCIPDGNFSCGEKEQRLIPLESTEQESQDFNNGLEAFKLRNYSQAINDFEKHLIRYKNDPEARVYYNNAKAANSGKFVKIAVCLPITGDPNNKNYSDGIAEEILRGVALVQNNINSTPNQQNLIQGDKMLFIQLCDDDNNTQQARKVANIIVKDSSIKGVIGHYSSPTTLAAGEIYDGKIPAVSPMSTAVRDNNNFPLSKYVFRVSPDDSYSVKKLVDYIRHKNLNRVAILHDSQNEFTRSLSAQFRQQVKSQKIVYDCDIKDKTKILTCIQEARKQMPEVMLLAITNKVVEQNTHISNLFSNPGNTILIGSSSLYTGRLRTINLQNKLIMALQWHRGGENSELKERSFQLWETQNINVRTAMGYEAAQAMAQALRKIQDDITPQKLYQALKDLKATDEFPAKGAIVNVEFNEHGDRNVDATNEDKLMFIVTPQYNLTIKEDDFLPPDNTNLINARKVPVSLMHSTH
ncbi:ABC transporter substrate-binding protein [Scytonema sp. UIC 10036]|uniref:bifunctional serine/threonine-protein kinase/ABC transporter substrate-binding protein n=1 Tax=Scytonema sp. UIC 10036 TaxID=2304196 RepID=UPI0012DADC20|nr:bifunctional serine/threonine-protein kinase/ABC transporter substrate-binding protein [Scytonema sp. UIC 10036]MUG99657.1 ABC transporter substrate-binding protein [Scytonema sp. UIC 10036]